MTLFGVDVPLNFDIIIISSSRNHSPRSQSCTCRVYRKIIYFVSPVYLSYLQLHLNDIYLLHVVMEMFLQRNKKPSNFYDLLDKTAMTTHNWITLRFRCMFRSDTNNCPFRDTKLLNIRNEPNDPRMILTT